METVAANPAETQETQAAEGQEGQPEKKRGAAKKISHPLLENDGKLTEVPADFDSKKHNVLKEADFADEHVDKFYDYKADLAKKEMEVWQAKAKEWQTLGGVKDRKTAKKVIETKREMTSLLAQMAENDPETYATLTANDPELKKIIETLTNGGESEG